MFPWLVTLFAADRDSLEQDARTSDLVQLPLQIAAYFFDILHQFQEIACCRDQSDTLVPLAVFDIVAAALQREIGAGHIHTSMQTHETVDHQTLVHLLKKFIERQGSGLDVAVIWSDADRRIIALLEAVTCAFCIHHHR